MTRYCYHNRHYHAWGAPHGCFCDPVRRPNGRCVVSKDKQLVRFEDGKTVLVIRWALRLRAKCRKRHG